MILEREVRLIYGLKLVSSSLFLICSLTHTHSHTHTHCLSLPISSRQPNAHTCSSSYAHTHAHTRTHTHTHAHTRTHAHSDTPDEAARLKKIKISLFSEFFNFWQSLRFVAIFSGLKKILDSLFFGSKKRKKNKKVPIWLKKFLNSLFSNFKFKYFGDNYFSMMGLQRLRRG